MFAQILAAIAGLATITGGVIFLWKWFDRKFKTTPVERGEEIKEDVRSEKQHFEDTGRPKG